MITIPTETLRDFLKVSQKISPSLVDQMSGYFKIEADKLIKTNLKIYCLYKLQNAVDETVLMDTASVSAYLSYTNKSEVSIETKDGKVWIDNKVSFPVMDASLFPAFPEHEKENHKTFDVHVLSALYAASQNTGQEFTNLESIYLKDNMVFASNSHKTVVYNFDDLPNILMDKECASIISQFNEVDFYEQGNYNFFDTGKCIFGFIKPEGKTIDFMRVVGGAKKDEWIEYKKQDLINFCNLVSGTNKVLLPSCFISGEKVFCTGNNECSDTFEVSGEYEMPETKFSHSILLAYLRSLPFTTVRFSPFAMPFFFTVWSEEDENFTGIFAGMSN